MTPESAEGNALFPMLPQETVIATFANKSVVVTSCRVRSYGGGIGESSLTSIFIEDVVSCSVVAISKPWLLVVGGLLLLGSSAMAMTQGSGVWITGILIALAFGVAYFLTLRNVVRIGSAGDSIRIDVAGAAEAAVHDLVNTIETAKEARYRLSVGRRAA